MADIIDGMSLYLISYDNKPIVCQIKWPNKLSISLDTKFSSRIKQCLDSLYIQI